MKIPNLTVMGKKTRVKASAYETGNESVCLSKIEEMREQSWCAPEQAQVGFGIKKWQVNGEETFKFNDH